MIETDRFQQVAIASLAELRAWLRENHAREDSVWLVRFRNTVPDKFVDRLDALDELLCFGWVDGIARKLDEQRTMQLISRRRQQAWSQSYKDRVARLEAEGRMQPPGQEAIARSKALGLWDAYAEVDALLVPGDLQAALAATPSALSKFVGAAPSYRRNVLRWISVAKQPATRAKRIAATVAAAAEGRRLPQM
jgi:uncharacterized protein YdeI (YjbR/CyaY-like superfamily)